MRSVSLRMLGAHISEHYMPKGDMNQDPQILEKTVKKKKINRHGDLATEICTALLRTIPPLAHTTS